MGVMEETRGEWARTARTTCADKFWPCVYIYVCCTYVLHASQPHCNCMHACMSLLQYYLCRSSQEYVGCRGPALVRALISVRGPTCRPGDQLILACQLARTPPKYMHIIVYIIYNTSSVITHRPDQTKPNLPLPIQFNSKHACIHANDGAWMDGFHTCVVTPCAI